MPHYLSHSCTGLSLFLGNIYNSRPLIKMLLQLQDRVEISVLVFCVFLQPSDSIYWIINALPPQHLMQKQKTIYFASLGLHQSLTAGREKPTQLTVFTSVQNAISVYTWEQNATQTLPFNIGLLCCKLGLSSHPDMQRRNMKIPWNPILIFTSQQMCSYLMV